MKKRCSWMLFLCFIPLWMGCAPAPTRATEESAVEKLSQTGLYADIKKEVLAKGVALFTPQFVLWTDGAKKRRWIYLPPGKKIDTTDMDMWKFPVGTKLWKEFARDGKRIETRLLHKIRDGEGMQGWIMVAYIWNDAQTEAVISKDGAKNQKGTPHDVPSAADCTSCHGGRESVSLGYSAIQLSHTGKGSQLPSLIKEKRLSHPPKGIFKVPGNAQERAALGYLHANCSGCHNRENKNAFSNPLAETKMFLYLRTDALQSVKDTDTYKTAIQGGGNWGPVIPGDANRSQIIQQMSGSKGGERMPPLGTEQVDQKGMDVLKTWINNIKH